MNPLSITVTGMAGTDLEALAREQAYLRVGIRKLVLLDRETRNIAHPSEQVREATFTFLEITHGVTLAS